MGQPVGVEEGDGQAELVGDLPHVLNGVGGIVVVFQEVKHTFSYKQENI